MNWWETKCWRVDVLIQLNVASVFQQLNKQILAFCNQENKNTQRYSEKIDLQITEIEYIASTPMSISLNSIQIQKLFPLIKATWCNVNCDTVYCKQRRKKYILNKCLQFPSNIFHINWLFSGISNTQLFNCFYSLFALHGGMAFKSRTVN